jgi:predicted PurR-regulated permease PerM
MNRANLNRIVIVAMVLLITAVFFAMIRPFLVAILLAGIFSAMAQPLYKRIEKWSGGRSNLASLVTLVFVFLIFFAPLVGLLGVIAGQAIKISQSVRPFIEQWMSTPSALSDRLGSLPFHESLVTYEGEIIEKLGELVGKVSSFLFNSVSSITFSTINTIFLFFVFLYTMFFSSRKAVRSWTGSCSISPYPWHGEPHPGEVHVGGQGRHQGYPGDRRHPGQPRGPGLLGRGNRGRCLLGHPHDGALHHTGVGSALIWFPAVVILALTGSYLKALGLLAFCSLLVGSVDNLLRPWLVGRDIKMHELMIFLGTLGGLSMFGLVGFIIGPIIAALFTTVWDIYAENFSDYLPGTGSDHRESD